MERMMFLMWARDSLQGLTGLALMRGCFWRSLWITLELRKYLVWFIYSHSTTPYDTFIHTTWHTSLNLAVCPLYFSLSFLTSDYFDSVRNQSLYTCGLRHTSRTISFQVFLEPSSPFYRLRMFWKFLYTWLVGGVSDTHTTGYLWPF
jgi:hypothetical protein